VEGGLDTSNFYSFSQAELGGKEFFLNCLPRTLLIFFSGAALALAGFSFNLGLALSLLISLIATFLSTVSLYICTAFFKPSILATFSFTVSLLVLAVGHLFGYSIARLHSTTLLQMLPDSESIGLTSLLVLIIATVLAILILSSMLEELEIMSVDEELALSRGVLVEYCRRKILLVAIFLSGIVAVVIGPLFLVGIAASSMADSYFGLSFRDRIPACFFIGGSILLVSDLLSHAFQSHNIVLLGMMVFLISSMILSFLALKQSEGPPLKSISDRVH